MQKTTFLFGSIADSQITIARLTARGRIQERTYHNPTPSSQRRILTYAANKCFRIESGSLTFAEYSI